MNPDLLYVLAEETADGRDAEAMILGVQAAIDGVPSVLPIVDDPRLRSLVGRRGADLLGVLVADWLRGYALHQIWTSVQSPVR